VSVIPAICLFREGENPVAQKRPLKITINVLIPDGVELFTDENGVVWIYKELGSSLKADKFVEFIQRICKESNWRNRLKNVSKKAQVLGLKRIYRLPDPRQGVSASE
jgi:hypothetical protein